MRLYYSPGSCSLSPHIVLREMGSEFELVKVDLRSHEMANHGSFYDVNDKGYVPVLELDDGKRLSEGVAIVQYLADQAPASKLAPPNGTFERYQLQEWLNFVTTEFHKQYSWLFIKTTPADIQESQRKKLHGRFTLVDKHLEGKEWLMGDTFTAADAYLFTVSRWNHHNKLDTSDLPRFTAWYAKVAARPAVQAAMHAEGIRA
jgi:glutathione S-transferase